MRKEKRVRRKISSKEQTNENTWTEQSEQFIFIVLCSVLGQVAFFQEKRVTHRQGDDIVITWPCGLRWLALFVVQNVGGGCCSAVREENLMCANRKSSVCSERRRRSRRSTDGTTAVGNRVYERYLDYIVVEYRTMQQRRWMPTLCPYPPQFEIRRISRHLPIEPAWVPDKVSELPVHTRAL